MYKKARGRPKHVDVHPPVGSSNMMKFYTAAVRLSDLTGVLEASHPLTEQLDFDL